MNERERSGVCRQLFSQPVPRSRVVHMRESWNERERARGTEFHTVQLLHPASHYTAWKEDHQDDTEFIPRNSSVISVIEHISFTVAEEINFLLDSNTANAYFTHLTFHLSPSIYTLWHLIKWPSSTYESVLYIQINHKTLTLFSITYGEQ